MPELATQVVLETSGAAVRKAFAHAPLATPEKLAETDVIIFGASTITGGDGSRMPSENELAIARFQGKHVAEIAKRLKGSA